MQEHHFVVCTGNSGYETSLELRKLYEVLPDADAEKLGHLRVDESGEDNLYPEGFFVGLDLPQQGIDGIIHSV